MDVSDGDQVWLQFGNMPRVLLYFCYIPPSDSPYFSNTSFAALQDKLHSCHAEDGYLIVRDLNARFGTTVKDLLTHIHLPVNERVSYPMIPDVVDALNTNAELKPIRKEVCGFQNWIRSVL